MPRILRFCRFAVWASFVISSARGADLANNLSQPFQASSSLNLTSWNAQAFTTTSTDFIIQSVTVAIHKSSSSTTGTLNLYFYDATGTGGRPGARVQVSVIGRVVASLLGTTPGGTFTWNNLNFTLSPNTKYYVVLGASGISNGSFEWDYTQSTLGVGFPSSFSDSTNGGASWFEPIQVNPSQMRVTAVPEPSTLALGGLAALALGCAARRKSGKRS